MPTPSVAVLSDAHLGDEKSWLERAAVQQAVTEQLACRCPGGTLVLLGDTLDLNFGTLTEAIEGDAKASPPRLGLRSLLASICSNADLARIIYVPGNHDYPIWDWEARQRNVLTPLSHGQALGGGILSRDVFDDSFLAGARPPGSRVRFSMAFPDVTVHMEAHRLLLTHGHHLDQVQTGGVPLRKVVTQRCPKRFLDRLEKASAQYQTFAYALAIRRSTRKQIHRWYFRITGVLDWLRDSYLRARSLRHNPISSGLLRTIQAYAWYVAEDPAPSAFVFGHTHMPGRGKTRPWRGRRWPVFHVFNSGSFVPPRKREASMLVVSLADSGDLVVEQLNFTKAGQVTVVRLL